jgi:hypothetical protein
MLTDRRAELRSSLEKLEGNGENKNFIFEFSNDKEVASHIPDVVKQVEQLAAPTKIGLVVGSGGLLTWGALLPSIDLWIQLDKNPQLLAWMKSLSDDIVSTPLMQTFETNLFSKVKGKAYKPQAYIEKSSYGQWHYLSQQYSYDRTRSFLSSSNYRGLIAQHDNGFDRYRERALVLLTEERKKRE